MGKLPSKQFSQVKDAKLFESCILRANLKRDIRISERDFVLRRGKDSLAMSLKPAEVERENENCQKSSCATAQQTKTRQREMFHHTSKGNQEGKGSEHALRRGKRKTNQLYP